MQKTCRQDDLPSLPLLPTLCGDLVCEAAVVGGGFTGLLTAFFLREQGVHTVVLEAGLPGSGASGSSDGLLTLTGTSTFHRLLAALGPQRDRRFLVRQHQALGEYEALIKRLSLPCFFRRLPLFLAFSAEKQRDREMAALRALLPEYSFPDGRLLCLPEQGQLHPKRFLCGLLPHLQLFVHSPVLSFRDGVLHTPQGRVYAKHVIFTAPLVPRMSFLRTHYLALDSAAMPMGILRSLAPDGLTLRPTERGVLLTSRSISQLLRKAETLWPDAVPRARWSCPAPTRALPSLRWQPGKPCGRFYAHGFSAFSPLAALSAAQFLARHIAETK